MTFFENVVSHLQEVVSSSVDIFCYEEGFHKFQKRSIDIAADTVPDGICTNNDVNMADNGISEHDDIIADETTQEPIEPHLDLIIAQVYSMANVEVSTFCVFGIKLKLIMKNHFI